MGETGGVGGQNLVEIVALELAEGVEGRVMFGLPASRVFPLAAVEGGLTGVDEEEAGREGCDRREVGRLEGWKLRLDVIYLLIFPN